MEVWNDHGQLQVEVKYAGQGTLRRSTSLLWEWTFVVFLIALVREEIVK